MTFSELAQHLINGAVNGSFYALLGAGFGLIFGVTGRFHLAFGTVFVAGAYIATALTGDGVPLLLALLGGLIFASLFGPFIEEAVYRPIVARAPTTGLLSVFVAALAVSVIGENLIRLIWGSQTKTLSPGFNPTRISLGGTVGLTTFELLIIVISWVAVVAVWLYLRNSRSGRAIRAVRANQEMASVVGISPRKVFFLVFLIGSALCAIASFLFTMRFALTPDSGLEPTFLALVVAFLAGATASPLRFALVGLAIGLIQSVATIWISPSWNDVVVFGLLFIYVAVRPLLEGGSPIRPRARRAVAQA